VTTADEPRWPPRAVRERGDGAAAFDDTVGGVSGVRLPGGRPSTDPGSLDPAGNVLGLYQAPTWPHDRRLRTDSLVRAAFERTAANSPNSRFAPGGAVLDRPEGPVIWRMRRAVIPG
jgi:hypothetical protein